MPPKRPANFDKLETIEHPGNNRGERGLVLCVNPACEFIGEPQLKKCGSTKIGLLLCLFGLVPGILYFVFTSGFIPVCPECGTTIKFRAKRQAEAMARRAEKKRNKKS